MNRGVHVKFRFGDLIENGYASTDNPRRFGIYVRTNWQSYEMTDANGSFWLSAKDNEKLKKIGNIMRDDEIKRLREALEEIKAKEWELAGEQTPSYLIAHFALEESK